MKLLHLYFTIFALLAVGCSSEKNESLKPNVEDLYAFDKQAFYEQAQRYIKALEENDAAYTVGRMEPRLLNPEMKARMIEMLESQGKNMKFKDVQFSEERKFFPDEFGLSFLIEYSAEVKLSQFENQEGIFYSSIVATLPWDEHDWYFSDVGNKDKQLLKKLYPNLPDDISQVKVELKE